MPRVTWDGTNPAQLSALLTTTFLKSRPEIVDNVFQNNPFWVALRVRGAVEYQDGGESIQIPLIYGENADVEAYNGYDLLSVTPQEGITSAIYQWKQYHVPVVISGRELMQNRGPQALARLLEAKRVQATKSLTGRLNMDAILGCAADPDRIHGLAQFVNRAPATQTDPVGNIAAQTYAWWRNQVNLAAGAWSTGPALTSMVEMYNLCSDGADHPDLILCDMDSFNNYERYATTVQGKNFTNTMWADLGFTNMSFKGATIVYDRQIPGAGVGDDGLMYFLNTAYFILIVHSERDFTFREFGYPPNQDAWISQIYWMGELCCSNRQRQGLLADTGTWA